MIIECYGTKWMVEIQEICFTDSIVDIFYRFISQDETSFADVQIIAEENLLKELDPLFIIEIFKNIND